MRLQDQSSAIIEQCKRVLQQHYGLQYRGLILYGSVARQQAEPDSDIDLLVLLTQPFDYFVEVRRIIDLLYPIQLASDRLISAKPVAVEAFDHGESQLYRNAKREGVRV